LEVLPYKNGEVVKKYERKGSPREVQDGVQMLGSGEKKEGKGEDKRRK
jgi:hypothetical protein